MDRASASGYSLTANDVPVVLGMVLRGDRKHDIAAWFGVNQGRIADAENGKYGGGAAAGVNALPPKGPAGIKGRALRESVGAALGMYDSGDIALDNFLKRLKSANSKYDANEP